MIDVLNITFRMSIQTSCDIYKSCDKVPETQMMASNGQGFLQFQVRVFLSLCRETNRLIEAPSPSTSYSLMRREMD